MRTRSTVLLAAVALVGLVSVSGEGVADDCIVNLGDCNGGHCVVNLEYCGGWCTINAGYCAQFGECTVNVKYGNCHDGGVCVINFAECAGNCRVNLPGAECQ